MVPRSAWLDAVSLQALAVRRGQPLIVLEERFRCSATGFSRYFLPMIFFHDGKDVIYDFGDDTEGTVRGVLESYPEARMIRSTTTRRRRRTTTTRRRRTSRRHLLLLAYRVQYASASCVASLLILLAYSAVCDHICTFVHA